MNVDHYRMLIPEDMLPDIVGQLLNFAVDPNHVEVVHGDTGREVLVATWVGDAWYAEHLAVKKLKEEGAQMLPPKPVEEQPAEPAPEPPATETKSSARTSNKSEDPRK